jgi:hypothetical protein
MMNSGRPIRKSQWAIFQLFPEGAEKDNDKASVRIRGFHTEFLTQDSRTTNYYVS